MILDKLVQRIANYEHWISSGFKDDIPDDIQKELIPIFSESPDAYTFYRNYLWRVLLETRSEEDELQEFLDFLYTSKPSNLLTEIFDYYETETQDIFESKRLNVFGIASEAPLHGLSQSSCFMYQSYYEIESILLLLASVAVLNVNGVKDTELNNLRDRTGRLKKGVAVDFIQAKLNQFPKLKAVFTSAYNAKLRNTIGHNEYRLTDEHIESLDAEINVAKSEFFESLYNLQKLNNFLIYFFSSRRILNLDFKDHGAISIGYNQQNERSQLLVFQLKCFFDIENKKEWFDKVHFEIVGDMINTKLPAKSSFKGKLDYRMKTWIERLKKDDYLSVIIQSIRPQMSLDENVLELEHGAFAICDDRVELNCPFDIEIKE